MQDPKFNSRGPDGKAASLEFDTGMGLVPEAMDMAVRLMTPQEVSTVAAHPKYAYQGRPDCPPVRSCCWPHPVAACNTFLLQALPRGCMQYNPAAGFAKRLHATAPPGSLPYQGRPGCPPVQSCC